LRNYASSHESGTMPAPVRLNHGIDLRDVSFRYATDGELVIRKLNLHLAAGTTVGLVGLNGAGKTTLMKLLTGMYRPTAGTITVDGLSMASMDPADWAARCSGVFQDFAKLQLSVRENVGIGDLPRCQDADAVADAVHRAGAASLVAALPQGADTQLGGIFGGEELSHGQWLLLALARGLMRQQPLLLILDEPTAALDPEVEHHIFEVFAAQARMVGARTGAVTLLVSHRFSTVHMADHIVVLSGGELEEQGTHDELLGLNGQYATLYRAQLKGYAQSGQSS
ncbi:ATP-binding cassette domain-containing protein, partial [Nonomuraea sp. NPDC004297]